MSIAPTTTAGHSDRLHAKHSPSSLKYKELCAGWIDRSEESAAAAEGQAMHEAAEASVRGDRLKFLALNDKQQFFVQQVLDYVEPLLAGATSIVPEVRIFNDDPGLRDLTHGTPDLLIFRPGICDLVDYKFGLRPVDHAQDNLQGQAYSLGVFDTYPEVKTVRVHFLSPRVIDGFTVGEFQRERDYLRILGRVKRVVERAELPLEQKELNPSWAACVYCGRKAKCKAFDKVVTAAFKLKAPPEMDTSFIKTALNAKTPEQRSDKLKVAEVLQDFAEQTKKDAIRGVIERGEDVAGYELRFTSRSSVKNAKIAFDALKEKIPVDRLLEISKVSIRDLEEAYSSGLEGEARKASRKEMMALLAKAGGIVTSDETKYLFRTNENT